MPWLPPSENFTGIAWPAFTTLTVGRLSTGLKNPPKAKVTFTWKVLVASLLRVSLDLHVTVLAPALNHVPEAGVQLTGRAPSTRSLAVGSA